MDEPIESKHLKKNTKFAFGRRKRKQNMKSLGKPRKMPCNSHTDASLNTTTSDTDTPTATEYKMSVSHKKDSASTGRLICLASK